MHDRLGIDQDVPFQQRAWRYQRLAWGVFGLTLIGALLGLFGQGPLADASIVDATGTVRLDYERLTRFDRLMHLTVSLSADHTSDALDVLPSLVKQQAPLLERWLDGKPLVLIDEGRPLTELMRRPRVDLQDILRAAREQGMYGLDRIRYAVLETSGSISIIPRASGEATTAQNGPLAHSSGYGV